MVMKLVISRYAPPNQPLTARLKRILPFKPKPTLPSPTSFVAPGGSARCLGGDPRRNMTLPSLQTNVAFGVDQESGDVRVSAE